MEDEGKMRNVAIPERRIERTDCRSCGQRIEHDSGEYGQSIERCGCLGGRWHPIIVDTTVPRPKATPMERAELRRLALDRAPQQPGRPGRPRKPVPER